MLRGTGDCREFWSDSKGGLMCLGYWNTLEGFMLAVHVRVCWGGTRLVAGLSAARGGARNVGCSVGTALWAGDPGVPTVRSLCK